MKNLIITISIFLFSICNLFGQINKGDIIISLNGNYHTDYEENSTYAFTYEKQQKYFNLSGEIEYFLTESFSVGLGVNHFGKKETRTNGISLMLVDNPYVQVAVSEIESGCYMPVMSINYTLSLAKNLYFNAKVSGGYGNIKSNYLLYYIASSDPSININNENEFPIEENVNSEYFTIGFYPELTYFLHKNIGIYLGLGGVKYELNNWNHDESYWFADFSPIYWSLGARLRF